MENSRHSRFSDNIVGMDSAGIERYLQSDMWSCRTDSLMFRNKIIITGMERSRHHLDSGIGCIAVGVCDILGSDNICPEILVIQDFRRYFYSKIL